MKKRITFVLLLIVLLTLTSCGKKKENKEKEFNDALNEMNYTCKYIEKYEDNSTATITIATTGKTALYERETVRVGEPTSDQLAALYSFLDGKSYTAFDITLELVKSKNEGIIIIEDGTTTGKWKYETRSNDSLCEVYDAATGTNIHYITTESGTKYQEGHYEIVYNISVMNLINKKGLNYADFTYDKKANVYNGPDNQVIKIENGKIVSYTNGVKTIEFTNVGTTSVQPVDPTEYKTF